jgi:hypothetical protein
MTAKEFQTPRHTGRTVRHRGTLSSFRTADTAQKFHTLRDRRISALKADKNPPHAT